MAIECQIDAGIAEVVMHHDDRRRHSEDEKTGEDEGMKKGGVSFTDCSSLTESMGEQKFQSFKRAVEPVCGETAPPQDHSPVEAITGDAQ